MIECQITSWKSEHRESEVASTPNSVCHVESIITISDRCAVDSEQAQQFIQVRPIIVHEFARQDFDLPLKLSEFKSNCETSEEYCELRNLIDNGFPNSHGELPENLRVFWKYQGELSVLKGLIVFNLHRFYVPGRIRNEVMARAHESHQDVHQNLDSFYMFKNSIFGLVTQQIVKCL